MNKKFEFEIVESIGVLSDGVVSTELNVVKWGDAEPKYDLRHWRYNTPYKGISLTVDELRALRDILNNMEI